MASSDDEDSEDGEPRKTGGYSAGPSSQAMAMLAAAPGHDHGRRHLAEGASAVSLAAFATRPPAAGTEAEVFDCWDPK